MNTPTSKQSFEFFYREFYSSLIGYVHGRFPKIWMFAEEVADDAFGDFWKYRAKNENKDVLTVLKRYARHRAISVVRKKKALKNGGGNLVSFEAMREVGFEPDEGLFAGNWRTGGEESEQVLLLEVADRLALVDRVLEVAIPLLPAKEQILLRHIRRWAPVELTLEELAEELLPLERVEYLPLQKRSLHRDVDEFVVREVGRSRSRLQIRLREVRDSLGL